MKQACIYCFLFLLFVLLLMIGENMKKEEKDFTVTFFACGASDAILIETKENTIMVDTGEAFCEKYLLHQLNKRKIKKIDSLILTHPDKDHIGNAVAILKNWKVGQVYQTDFIKNSKTERELQEFLQAQSIPSKIVKEDTTLTLGGMTVLIKPPHHFYDTENNSSLVTWIDYQDISLFLGADIKKDRIKEMLEEELKTVDLIKMPYHGRKISNMKQLLERLSPSFAVITNNKVPKDTKQLLEKLNIPYSNTKTTLEFTSNGKTLVRER